MSLLSASEFLRLLAAHGVVPRVGGSMGLVVDREPVERLPAELRAEMIERRDELRRWIENPPAWQPRLDFDK